MARSSQSFYRPPERSSKREKGQFYPTTYSQKKLEDKIWNPEESSEDEDDEESFATGTEGLQKKSFQPQRRLAPANVIKRDLQQLMDLLETPYLDLNPEYQRDVVWNKTRMTGLINSLFEDYYIPPIIFNRQKITIEDGTQRWKRICVDGKQRLSSARAFMEGKIPVKDRNGDKWY